MSLAPRRHPSTTTRWFQELLWGERRGGPLREGVRLGGMALWKFQADRGLLRASALTYTSLLSLVPLLALMFAVLKGLGVQRRLEPLLLERIAVGNQELVAQIIEYVDRTKIGALGALGLITLLLTAVSVLGNVELSFNDIWQVRKGRSLVRKVSDYIALLVVGPVLLLASLSVTTSLQASTVFQQLTLVGPAVPYLARLLPFVAIWLAFTAAYLIMPNCSVPLRAALLGGGVASLLWQVAEGAYIEFQFGVAKYNAIYGAMAQLPVLLVWIYVSWCVVLFGAELAYLFQLPGRGRFLRVRRALWVPRLDVALGLLLAVARRFEHGRGGVPEGELVAELGLEPGESGPVVSRLVEAGLLALDCEDPPRLLPGRSPDRTTVVELFAALTELQKLDDALPGDLTQQLRSALDGGLGAQSWADLALAYGDEPQLGAREEAP